MKQNTLYRLLSNKVKENGSRLFLQKKDGWSWKQLTWLDFDVEVKNVASFLADSGFLKGEKILILSPNHLKCYILKCAALVLGGVIVSVSEHEFERNRDIIFQKEGIRFIAVDKEDTVDLVLLQKETISRIIVFSPESSFHPTDKTIAYNSVVKVGSLKKRKLVDQLEENMKSIHPSDPAIKIIGFNNGEGREKIITQGMLLTLLNISSKKLRFLSSEDQFYALLSESGLYSNLVSFLPSFLGIRGTMTGDLDEFFQDIKEIMPTLLFIDTEILTDRVGTIIKENGGFKNNIRNLLGRRLRYLVVDKPLDSLWTSSLIGSGISIIELTEFSAFSV